MTPSSSPTLALKHQVLGLLLTLSAAYITAYVFQNPMSLGVFLLCTGTLAAFFSIRTQQRFWWPIIHFVFPLCVVVAYAYNFPPSWYLVALGVAFLWYGAVYRTGVPFFPSTKSVHGELTDILATIGQDGHVVDIGCGIGGIALTVKKTREDLHVVGVEIALLQYLVCVLRTLGVKRKPEWILGDLAKHNLGKYDLVYAYLSPSVMPMVEAQLLGQCKPGCIVVSLEFSLPTLAPDEVKSVGRKSLYIYRI